MNKSNRHHQTRFPGLLLLCALGTVAVCSPVIGCQSALAAEEKLVPSCEFKEEFNDNVFLTSRDRKSDYIMSLAPSLAFSHKTESLDIDLHSGLNWHNYAHSEGIKSTDYQYNAQVANKLTVLDDVGLSATYVRSTRPDSINQTTKLSNSTGSDHYQYSANIGRALNETTSASLTYSFVKDSYDDSASQANTVHSTGLAVSKNLSAILPLLKGTLSTNFSRAIYRDSTSDIYSLRAGISRNFTENFTANLSAGGQFIHSDFAAAQEANNDSLRAIGSVSLNYSGEKTLASFLFDRNFSAASGQVGAVETSSFGLTLKQNLSEKTSAQVAASYSINQASSGHISAQSSDDRVINVKADLLYNVSKFCDIGLQYSCYTVNYNATNTQITQNSLMLRAIVKNPLAW
jgi:hypothetical protein